MSLPDFHISMEDIEELPSLSVCVKNVLMLFDQGRADISNVEREISKDPILTSKLLHIANSPFYGLAGKINDARSACMVLGLPTVHGIVTATGFISRFPPDRNVLFDRHAFWEHSIATGIASKIIAERSRENADHAFIAGLLHDIGRILIDTHYPEVFKAILMHHNQNNCLLMESEKQVSGLTHAELGASLLKSWHLPESICDAIEWHHALQPPNKTSLIIQLADVLTQAMGLGNSGNIHLPELTSEIIEGLNMDFKKIKNMLPDIEELFRKSNFLEQH